MLGELMLGIMFY